MKNYQLDGLNKPEFTYESKHVESIGSIFHDKCLSFGRTIVGFRVGAIRVRIGIGHIPNIEDSIQGADVFMPSGMVPLQFRSAVRTLLQFAMEIHSLLWGNPVFG
ncbi:hypothetical protein NSS79_01170 [Paenibacillus sp. FSL L8-0436]|uniref:hypothetical protein n=1 Tax=Paenibacillus sp. FSL L8-0436 TaxID=2954686 RepID=UPI0031593E33